MFQAGGGGGYSKVAGEGSQGGLDGCVVGMGGGRVEGRCKNIV